MDFVSRSQAANENVRFDALELFDANFESVLFSVSALISLERMACQVKGCEGRSDDGMCPGRVGNEIDGACMTSKEWVSSLAFKTVVALHKDLDMPLEELEASCKQLAAGLELALEAMSSNRGMVDELGDMLAFSELAERQYEGKRGIAGIVANLRLRRADKQAVKRAAKKLAG